MPKKADDYISRKAALSVVCNGVEFARLRAIPAADVVKVVRCQECENWTKQTNNPGPDGLGACSYLKANMVTGEGYCYWGQRKEDGCADNGN